MSESKGLVGVISAHAKHAVFSGVVMVIAGVLAIAAPFVAGASIMLMLGVMLLVGGVAQCFLAFKADAFGRGLLILVLGALTAAAGVWMLREPLSALGSVTLLLASYFFVSGLLELFGAFSAGREAGRGWLIFSAVLSMLLGVMLWRQFPLSGIWAVGTLVGVRLLTAGASLIAIGSAVRTGVKGATA